MAGKRNGRGEGGGNSKATPPKQGKDSKQPVGEALADRGKGEK